MTIKQDNCRDRPKGSEANRLVSLSNSNISMRRMTGCLALVSVGAWLATFPLYRLGDPSVSLYDGTAVARDFFRI